MAFGFKTLFHTKEEVGWGPLLTHITLKGLLTFHPQAGQLHLPNIFQMGKLKQKRQHE